MRNRPTKGEVWFRDRLATMLRERFRWFIQQHEDRNSVGIPDWSFAANGTDGWIEVKYLPKKPASLAAIPHYTAQQRQWLKDQGEAGSGHCYLLIGMPDCFVMWPWHALSLAHDLNFPKAAVECACASHFNLSDMAARMNARCRSGG